MQDKRDKTKVIKELSKNHKKFMPAEMEKDYLNKYNVYLKDVST